MDEHGLTRQYQTQLVDALVARIAATEEAAGPIFAFDIQRRGATTLVVAHHWPDTPQYLPFHRIYNYTGPEDDDDALLDYCIRHHLDAIVETQAAPDHATKHLLDQRQFSPHWSIPWLQLDLTQQTPYSYPHLRIRQVAADEMDAFATLFVDAYGYHGASATAWHTFIRHGYRAAGFHCFVAEMNHVPVGVGVLHVQGTTALVDGAATVPHARSVGVQKALLTARVGHARALGCTHAFSRTGAGSISQQNLEKVGFHEVCRTLAWRRTIES